MVSSQPIGSLLRMSAPGSLSAQVVIETEQEFYPLLSAASIAKGTPLMLEVRGSGRRYICDTPRSLCLETSSDHFAAAPQGTKP